jgi:signal transduction histidine kinase
VCVSDNGIGCKKIMKGIGISGMEERITNLGGSILIPNKVNGFEILASIPWKGTVK